MEGIGWFTYETLRRMAKAHPEVEFYFFFDRPYHPDFVFGENVKPVVIGPQARHPVLFVIWFEWSLRRALKHLSPDIFLSPDAYLSLGSKVPAVAVMHDLNFEHFPADLPWLVRWYYRYFFPRFARAARRIATVSEFSKRDIIEQYGVDASKIDVVYNGANERFVPVSAEVQGKVRAQYSEGAAYFLFVGSLHPRKNLARLFRAFDIFKQGDGQGRKLLVVGEKKWWTAEIREAYASMRFRADVIFAGRLEAEDLHLVTASALASVYVSYFEGFGIPIVEAFRCGVPVITADATATREIGAEAAYMVDPFSEQSIAAALTELSEREDLRKELVSRGMKRAEDFTWDAASERLWETLTKALEKNDWASGRGAQEGSSLSGD